MCIILGVIAFSCQTSYEKLLEGNWQIKAVQVYRPYNVFDLSEGYYWSEWEYYSDDEQYTFLGEDTVDRDPRLLYYPEIVERLTKDTLVTLQKIKAHDSTILGFRTFRMLYIKIPEKQDTPYTKGRFVVLE